MAEAFAKIKLAKNKADVIELRVDGISDLDLALLLKPPRPPCIITHRLESEGGKFKDGMKEHLQILLSAMRLGAEYVDVELRCGINAIETLLQHATKTKIIVSSHNFQKMPADLLTLYHRMESTGAHILKIAVMAKDITDNQHLFALLNLAHSRKRKLIALCMGERGEISRILQGKYHGYLTYAPLDDSEATAPGQRSLQDLIKIFRVPILTTRTKVFGLIGNPVSHSKGIYFHNKIFKQKKLSAVYVNFLVDNLPQFINTYRNFAQGFSVTMPYKQEILPLLDTVEPEISVLKAVNTVINRTNNLHGMNLDFAAIVACLKKRLSMKGKRVTILGTGGTARTMAIAALSLGAKPAIVGRNKMKAMGLALEFGCTWLSQDALNEIHTDVVVNATSVGMNSTKDIPFNVHRILRSTMTVFDAVYTPPVTPLLQKAEQAGCKIISGEELFRTQARLQSKVFCQAI